MVIVGVIVVMTMMTSTHSFDTYYRAALSLFVPEHTLNNQLLWVISQ